MDEKYENQVENWEWSESWQSFCGMWSAAADVGGERGRHKCDVDKNPPPTRLPPIKRDKNIACQQRPGLVSEYAATMGAIVCSSMFSHFEPLVYFRNNRHSSREQYTTGLLKEPLLTNRSPDLLGSLYPCLPSLPIRQGPQDPTTSSRASARGGQRGLWPTWQGQQKLALTRPSPLRLAEAWKEVSRLVEVGSASIYVSLTALTHRQDGGVSVVGSGVHRSARTDSVRSPAIAFPGFLLAKTTEGYWQQIHQNKEKSSMDIC